MPVLEDIIHKVKLEWVKIIQLMAFIFNGSDCCKSVSLTPCGSRNSKHFHKPRTSCWTLEAERNWMSYISGSVSPKCENSNISLHTLIISRLASVGVSILEFQGVYHFNFSLPSTRYLFHPTLGQESAILLLAWRVESQISMKNINGYHNCLKIRFVIRSLEDLNSTEKVDVLHLYMCIYVSAFS